MSKRKILNFRISTKDQVFFAKRLSFLIAGNIPILESLHILKDQSRSKKYKEMLDIMIHDISNGQQLSKTLAKFPNVFSSFAVNMVKVGEASGTLSQNLQYLSDELAKKQALKRKVMGTLIYPAFIVVTTLAITIFLTIFLFPKIMPVFISLHIDLPLTTRILLFISVFLQKWWVLLVLAIFFFTVLFTALFKKNIKFRLLFDRLVLKLPIFGKLSKWYNLANFCRTLGLLLKSGMTFSSAISMTADTTSNLEYKKHMEEMEHSIHKGKNISSYLKRHPQIFPETIFSMVQIGEKSGKLSETLIYVSQLYEKEVEDFTKEMSTLIEPILMVFMGTLVGFIAISIITPIYSITQHLSPR